MCMNSSFEGVKVKFSQRKKHLSLVNENNKDIKIIPTQLISQIWGCEDNEKNSSHMHAMDIMEDCDYGIPTLIEDKGYFLLGNEDKALKTFYFNVYITHGKNLQGAISRPNAASSRSQSKYFFSYDLFGVAISTILVSYSTYFLTKFLGLNIAKEYCLLFSDPTQKG